eukprot:scaffold15497_cov126-Cyclotella_meneghiniana.AAC.2
MIEQQQSDERELNRRECEQQSTMRRSKHNTIAPRGSLQQSSKNASNNRPGEADSRNRDATINHRNCKCGIDDTEMSIFN